MINSKQPVYSQAIGSIFKCFFFFLVLIPCQAAMNRSTPMNLVHPVCKIHAERRRLHLLENSFAKAKGAGFSYTFPLSLQLQGEQHLLETFVPELCDTLRFQSNLHYMNVGDTVRPWGTTPSLYSVFWQQCNSMATTSISLRLICGSGMHSHRLLEKESVC